jgi:hypothetical protein
MHGRPPATRIITAFGAFQLNHLGAQHGQDLARERPRQILRNFNYPDTGQRRHAKTLSKRGKSKALPGSRASWGLERGAPWMKASVVRAQWLLISLAGSGAGARRLLYEEVSL